MNEQHVEKPVTFELELENLINKYSKENDSNTPDWILANYLNDCLEAFNLALKARTTWYNADEDEDVGL